MAFDNGFFAIYTVDGENNSIHAGLLDVIDHRGFREQAVRGDHHTMTAFLAVRDYIENFWVNEGFSPTGQGDIFTMV
jgi:hypothetical protein